MRRKDDEAFAHIVFFYLSRNLLAQREGGLAMARMSVKHLGLEAFWFGSVGLCTSAFFSRIRGGGGEGEGEGGRKKGIGSSRAEKA
jgi:hypothetical protein